MKKTITILAALFIAVAANAKILRVSNVVGSSAPYSSISDALKAATDGDTIMVDGSNNGYGSLVRRDLTEVAKKVVIIGPGYWLTENGRTDIGATSAIIDDIDICADGVEIYGMVINGKLTIASKKVVVNRCRIIWGIGIEKKLEDIIIHQNVIRNGIKGELYDNSNGLFPPVVTISNVQITNNIFMGDSSGSGSNGTVMCFTKSLIANNTWAEWAPPCLSQIYDSTVKDNIMCKNTWDNRCDGTTFSNNAEIDYNVINLKTDLDVLNFDILQPYSSIGAFAGTDPYVISGIPAGPIITDLEMPTTVEMGSKLNVTIKVDISR